MQEVAAIENSRQTPEECRMIHLFPNTIFVSAYNWSAWLLDRCGIVLAPCLVKDNSFGGQAIRVGFPNQSGSWQKFTPNFVIRDNSSTPDHVIWNLPDTAFKPEETPAELKRQYDEWVKKSLPGLIEKAKEKKKSDAQQKAGAPQAPGQQPQASAPTFAQPTPPPTANPKAESLFDVLRNISQFDIDGRTAREAQEFLRKAQDDIRRLYGL